MLRQLLLVSVLAVAVASCASLERAFAPAPNPWPVPKDGRVRRDGRLLRVYGASLKSKAEAEADARLSLEAWLWTLDLGDDVSERKGLIGSVLTAPEARTVPSPVPEISGFTALIELDLPSLQKKLGTRYE